MRYTFGSVIALGIAVAGVGLQNILTGRDHMVMLDAKLKEVCYETNRTIISRRDVLRTAGRMRQQSRTGCNKDTQRHSCAERHHRIDTERERTDIGQYRAWWRERHGSHAR